MQERADCVSLPRVAAPVYSVPLMTEPDQKSDTPRAGTDPLVVAPSEVAEALADQQTAGQLKPASLLAQARFRTGTIWPLDRRRTLYPDHHPLLNDCTLCYPFKDAGRRQVVPFSDAAQGLMADMAQAYEGHDTYQLTNDDLELLARFGMVKGRSLREGAVREIETLLMSLGFAPSFVSELSFRQAIGLMRSRSPLGPDAPRAAKAGDNADGHGDVFEWVKWHGRKYVFTRPQARAAVEVLWGANGEWVHEDAIRDRIGSDHIDRFRLGKVFRHGSKDHDAWGTMIEKQGPRTRMYRIAR